MPKWMGALVPGSLLVLAAMPAQAAQYAVNDFILGTQLPAAAFRDYRCGPSEQFDGFIWCQRSRPGGARRGPFSVTQSLLHSRDGKIAYINRQQSPVVFEGNDVDDDIRSFSRRFGAQPRITRLPRRPGGLEGVMALWGDVAVEPLDDDSVKVLADGKSPRKGFLVDYAGNLTKSAQDGLPVFRITGGAGFIWAASFDQRGRGTLRITAVDVSVLSPDTPPPKPVAESPSPESAAAPAQVATAAEPPSGTGRVRTEIVDPRAQPTEKVQPAGTAEPQVADPEPPAKVESAKVEPVNAPAATTEAAKAESARFEVQTAETQIKGAAGEPASADDELARLRTTTRLAFAIVAALLIALVATLLMIFGRRKRANDAMLAANAKRGSLASAAPAPSAEAAGPRLPTYAPAIDGGRSTAVHTVFDSPAATRAAASTRRDSEPPAAPSHDATEADPAPPSPAAMEEQSALSIVPGDPPEAAEAVALDAPAGEDPVQRLVELAKLRASGMLTESEFNQLKASIIAATARDSAAPSDRPPHAAL